MASNIRKAAGWVCLAWVVLALTPLVSGADDFPNPPDTEPLPGSPMPAEQAARSFQVPEGFRVSVFATEPDVRNPIGMAWDARGRLWVAENYTYAERTQKFDLKLRDRVVVLEDADRDGRAERRKVFTDNVQRLSSVELGHGGVWLLCPPQLLFVPDANGDDVPDGAAEVVLDGFTVPAENYHNFANGLKWGPDGWLYGRCGCSAPGKLGAPGTPDERRVPINGGLWRYHPRRKTVEVVAHGTTNPWGHDWNSRGEAFFINTVNGHLWHAVPGAHFVRPHTVDPNPYVYQPIDQHADHWHWDHSKDWTDSRNVTGEHDRLGGGHAHSGLMIYQGDNWPASYRDELFTLNLHGRRVNRDPLERLGGGYVGRHKPDPFRAADPWFRGIDLSYGPDGRVYVLDWSDAGECHESTGVHRSSGRIFTIGFDQTNPTPPRDVSRLTARELADLHGHANEWYVRQARRLLAERAARGEPVGDAVEVLRKRFEAKGDVVQSLRALWTLYAIGSADQSFLLAQLEHPEESVRSWAVRLLTDDRPIDDVLSVRRGPDPLLPEDVLSALCRRAAEDRSALVRLTLASTLQRLPVGQRARLAAPLTKRTQDASDHDIPQMVWFGLIPLAESDPSVLAGLAVGCELPTTRRLMVRRLAEEIQTKPTPVGRLIEATAKREDAAFARDVLAGVADGLLGQRKAARPSGWDALVKRFGNGPDQELRDRVRDLSVVFGDGRALGEVTRLALDDRADMSARRAAVETLIAADAPDLRSVCEKLLRVRFLNATAAKGLARFDDPAIGRVLAASYRQFHPSNRPAVIDALVSRPGFALAMLDQMAKGGIPRGDLSAYQARQVRSLGDPAVSTRLAEVWGELRDSDGDRRAAVSALKERLTPTTLASADPGRGRVVFDKICASCHTLYGRGGDAGPDLTGAGRHDLDYLLENILDPGATVSADFRVVVVALEDGRVLNGLVKAKTDRALTVRTPTETIVLDRSLVSEVKPTAASLMPDGLLAPLRPDEVSDLFAYLMTRTQVPLPSSK